MAIPIPIMNSEASAILKTGKNAKSKEPEHATPNATNIDTFSPIFSTIAPAGIDITPYARNMEKGKKAAIVRLNP
jgi:hypothetical protein